MLWNKCSILNCAWDAGLFVKLHISLLQLLQKQNIALMYNMLYCITFFIFTLSQSVEILFCTLHQQSFFSFFFCPFTLNVYSECFFSHTNMFVCAVDTCSSKIISIYVEVCRPTGGVFQNNLQNVLKLKDTNSVCSCKHVFFMLFLWFTITGFILCRQSILSSKKKI